MNDKLKSNPFLHNKLNFELSEERFLNEVFLQKIENFPVLWKVGDWLSKINYYSKNRKQLKFKIIYFFHKLVKSEKFKTLAFPDTFEDAYKRKAYNYSKYRIKSYNKNSDLSKIYEILSEKKYSGIIVYPSTIHWEPLQRPQQLLREFAKLDYLCFFCEPKQSHLSIVKVESNLYTISGDQYLIYPLQNFDIIILCTWMLNLPFANLIPKKFLWYDIIDRLEIFSLYDEKMLNKHEQFVEAADLVTYSGLQLTDFTKKRSNAIYLPNGVITEDFTNLKKTNLKKFPTIQLRKDKPIIGFYGAIAEWLDFKLIHDVANKSPEWEFVFIGQIWTDINEISRLPNVHFTGLIPYKKLPEIAINFDIGIIPFTINDLTNSVSPIKFFEYAALGLPVVTTSFYEITQYKGESFLQIASSTDEFIEAIRNFLNSKLSDTSEDAKLFANKHHWAQRVKKIIKYF
ncbi:MAG: hypothetical protein CL609_09195 [Anaerolineaceae bacterium]|nr:hypothetical protein [Anaerolineaceae bacterium]